ncbi:polysaccharide deacetylase family protein [Lysobacter sp. BMK333-48F3]|uniref:polysaccharide deacetylase family protein n=1 Tax=Lysobacter sp. BMK333-48F3 TaxID=2867962 RepID=UPI001C8BDB59|nr:polysaccharide deacetylase family protein [Lysobacter sp. BMK333-48F3]MBX9401473.1 polysaccharide deacetylase family protein [Lysobacter sp. BMK333-48F3]
MDRPFAAAHRPPRRPWAWAVWFAASQALVAALWWRYGWAAGLASLMASHAAMFWGTLWPRSRLFGPVLSRLPTAERAVWLTIDDGPSADTEAMLDLLDAHRAKATFFVVAERAERHAGLLREIVRRGHEVGNHSHSHPSAWFWALGPRAMAREIGEAQQRLAALLPQPPRWFRAVVGMANPFTAAPLRRHGLSRVAWSARGFDAVEADPDKVVARIERDLAPGAIVLMHEGSGHGRNLEAMKRLLARLDELGYRCVLPEARADA